MNRRNAGLALLLGLLAFGAAPLAAEAQQARKVYRIGYLSTPTRESVERGLQAFLRKLRELGWVEGPNLIIEYRWAEGNVERLPDLAAELVRLKVDVIVAPAGSAALAAKKATSSIPIVMIFPSDPVEIGLVDSLSRPGGNITGTTFTPGSGDLRQAAANSEGDDPARFPSSHTLEPGRPIICTSNERGRSERPISAHPPSTRGGKRSRGVR